MSAYNTRRAECQEAVEHFRQCDSFVRALRDVDMDLIEKFGGELSPVVRRRCRHVVGENERALAAVAALKSGSLGVFGRLMTEAGFGGCTVSLVQKDAVPGSINRLGDYTTRFNLAPGVFVLERNLEAGPVSIDY